MGAVLAFFNVLAVIVVFLAAAINMEIFLLLESYGVIVSIVFWGLLLLFAYMSGKNEKDKEGRYMMYAFPGVFLPTYVFLYTSVSDFVNTKGFEILLLPVMTVMCVCFTLALGLGVFLLCTKVKSVASVPLTYIVEIIIAYWLFSLGG